MPLVRFLAVGVLTLSLLTACSTDDDGPAGPPPSPTSGSASPPNTTPTLPPLGAPGDAPTGPGPTAGAPCPVDQATCDFARQVLSALQAGDADAFMRMAEPVEATCPSRGFGGPSPSLCQGAREGETRRGYWDIQGGEGLIVPEADFRRTLQRWFESISAASGSDVYGSGQVRIGSISCARRSSDPPGSCSAGMRRVHFTFINPPNLDPARGTGLPGQRTSFHVSLHEGPGGQLRIDGFGSVVPPNTVLLAFRQEFRLQEGQPVTLQYYPWTP
jgi:hypothetical protein